MRLTCCQGQPHTLSGAEEGHGADQQPGAHVQVPSGTVLIRKAVDELGQDYAAALGHYATLGGVNTHLGSFSQNQLPPQSATKARSPASPPAQAGPQQQPPRLQAKKSPLPAERTMGTLTAWQLLAADVQREMQQEMELGAEGSGRHGRHSNRSSSCSSEDPAAQLQLDSEESGEGRDAARRGGCRGGRGSGQWEGQGGGRSDGEGGETEEEEEEEQLWSGQGVAASTGGGTAASTLGSSLSGSASPYSGSRFAQHYVPHEELGRGAFGRAIRAERRCDGAAVCVKVLETGGMSKKERAVTRDEVRVLSRLRHPNIVAYHECFSEGGLQYIVMEFCEEGDLERFIKGRRGELLPEDEVMLRFVQACLALQHVHAQGVLHRDIKSNNIFCRGGKILKLGDFGIAKVLGGEQSCARTMVGTPYYLSPELVQDKPYNGKSDVWALGCVLYELCSLRRPFSGQSVSAIAVKILRGTYAPIPDQYSPQLHQLVALLLSRKVDKRPTIDQILGSEYVRGHMQRYQAHVEGILGAAGAPYARSLAPFQLGAPQQKLPPPPQQQQQEEEEEPQEEPQHEAQQEMKKAMVCQLAQPKGSPAGGDAEAAEAAGGSALDAAPAGLQKQQQQPQSAHVDVHQVPAELPAAVGLGMEASSLCSTGSTASCSGATATGLTATVPRAGGPLHIILPSSQPSSTAGPASQPGAAAAAARGPGSAAAATVEGQAPAPPSLPPPSAVIVMDGSGTAGSDGGSSKDGREGTSAYGSSSESAPACGSPTKSGRVLELAKLFAGLGATPAALGGGMRKIATGAPGGAKPPGQLSCSPTKHALGSPQSQLAFTTGSSNSTAGSSSSTALSLSAGLAAALAGCYDESLPGSPVAAPAAASPPPLKQSPGVAACALGEAEGMGMAEGIGMAELGMVEGMGVLAGGGGSCQAAASLPSKPAAGTASAAASAQLLACQVPQLLQQMQEVVSQAQARLAAAAAAAAAAAGAAGAAEGVGQEGTPSSLPSGAAAAAVAAGDLLAGAVEAWEEREERERAARRAAVQNCFEELSARVQWLVSVHGVGV